MDFGVVTRLRAEAEPRPIGMGGLEIKQLHEDILRDFNLTVSFCLFPVRIKKSSDEV
ncbi:MAG TPA: hypothetical protein GX721_09195, partial [Firmicutes bacterium]|nr:hypothetical protein [Bacillota bacterium]